MANGVDLGLSGAGSRRCLLQSVEAEKVAFDKSLFFGVLFSLQPNEKHERAGLVATAGALFFVIWF